MKLTNMAMTEAEARARYEPSTASDMKDAPRYPWGLCINLDNDSLKKLGLTDDMPEVGEEYLLTATVKVTSCSSSDTEGGGKNQSCSLQIVEMALTEEKGQDAAEVLYK